MPIYNNTDPKSYVTSAVADNDATDKGFNLVQKNNDLNNSLFNQINLDKLEVNWNQAYPYQLRIISEKTRTGGERDSTITPIASFTLPIPPQDLNISMPFASLVTPTLGGIVEEHSGAPFRIISLSGTTGVMPTRPSADLLPDVYQKGAGNPVANTVLAGTISSFNNVTAPAARLDASFSGNPKPVANIIADITSNATSAKTQGLLQAHSTGFYQFHLLKHFLEYYSNVKKTTDGASMRLTLAIYKTGEQYYVTPQRFDAKQSVASPLEIQYTLQLKAWKRTGIELSYKSLNRLSISPRTPDLLSKVLASIQDATAVLSGLDSVISAVRSDVNRVLFDPLREATIFIKTGAGLALDLTDLPINILRDTAYSWQSNWNIIQSSVDTVTGLPKHVQDLVAALSAGNLYVQKSDATANTAGSSSQKQALGPTDASGSGSPYNSLDKFLKNPREFYPLLAKIDPNQLKLSPFLKNKIDAEKNRVKSLTRAYFVQKRADLQALTYDFADSLGLGDPTFNAIFNRPKITPIKTPTSNDYDTLFALNKALMALDSFIVNAQLVATSPVPTAIEVTAGLAKKSGIVFQKPISKFAIPMPYGVTLERLAAQYLNNPDRWIEIAALNGLRSPYVDENGFDLTLLANGNGNQILVNDASNLFIGQSVIISSLNVLPEKRHIINIVKVNDGVFSVNLDGALDLAKLTTLASAKIHAYLPGTVNSQMIIYIPSPKGADQDPKLKTIPGVDDLDGLLNIGGIDLLLDQNNDILVTPDGDSKYAYGLTNLVQSAKIILSTPINSILRHKRFGVDLKVGDSLADTNAQDIVNAIINTFKSDGRFSGVNQVSVIRNGPATFVKFVLGVAGTEHLLPISIQIPT